MRYVRCYLAAMMPWLSLLSLISCKGALQWTSTLNNPTITNVRALNAAGKYKNGRISIRVTFSEEVLLNTSNGTPYIELNTTPNTARANLVNCSTLTINSQTKFVCDFEYIVQINENADPLDYKSTDSFILNGAEIVDTEGYPLRENLPIAGSGNSLAQSNIVIDTEPPKVTSVTAIPNLGTLITGDVITIIVSFTEAIKIGSSAPHPTLLLKNGVTLTYDPSYDPGFSLRNNELVFKYTVNAGDTYIDHLDYDSNSALVAAIDEIEDVVGNFANLTLPNPGDLNALFGKTNIEINPASTNGIARVISVHTNNGVAKTLGTGDSVDLIVKFNRNVGFSSSEAYINLNVDTANGEANLVGYGSNSSELVFRYQAQSSHSADMLLYEPISSSPSMDALYLNTGTSITDASSGSNAVLALPSNAPPLSPAILSLRDNYSRKKNSVKVVPYPRPTTPTDFAASFVGHNTLDPNDDSSLTLTWTADGVSYYVIERSIKNNTGDTDVFSYLTTVYGNSGQYIDKNLQLGKIYNYRIRSVRGELSGNKENSGDQSLKLVVNPTYGSAGADWNDYVLSASEASSSTSMLDSGGMAIALAGTSAPCTSPSDYRSCVHGGEKKQIILYGVDQATCESTINPISVNEYPDTTSTLALDIFNWSKCHWIPNTSLINPITSVGAPEHVAVVFSLGFKEGKGLRDLIDPATTSRWKAIQAKVSVGSASFYSPLYDWWGNTVEELPGNGSSGLNIAVSLNETGRVYFSNSTRDTRGYSIDSDNISIVTLGSNTLSWTTSAIANANTDGSVGTTIKSPIISNGKNFLWVEANINGDSTAHHGLLLGKITASRIHNTRVSNMCTHTSECGAAIHIDEGIGNIFYNISVGISKHGFFANKIESSLLNKLRVAEASSTSCIELNDADNNSLTNISASNCYQDGIKIIGDNNSLNQIVVANSNSHGIHVDNGQHNTLTAITTTNNINSGIALVNAPNTTLHSVLASNNGSNTSMPSIFISGSNSKEITLSQLVTTKNHTNAGVVNIQSGADKIKFTGNFLKEDALQCLATSGAPGPHVGINPDCTIQSTITYPEYLYPDGDPRASNHNLLEIGTDFLFFNKNGDPTSGGTVQIYGNLSDPSIAFSALSSIFNGWGVMPASGAWPEPSYLGKCSTGDCVLNNWALSSEPTNAHSDIVRNTTIDGSYLELSLTNEQPCPSEIENFADFSLSDRSGNILYTYPASGISQVFHKIALEVVGDLSGDEDGLCEHEEQCLYMPNYGAYQGEGKLSSCEIINNNVIRPNSNHMFFYETNGLKN